MIYVLDTLVADNLMGAPLCRRTNGNMGDEGEDEAYVPAPLAETQEQTRLLGKAAISRGTQSTGAAAYERPQELGMLKSLCEALHAQVNSHSLRCSA